MCVIHIQVRVENGTVCAIAGSDAFLINTMDHGEWTSSFTVLGRVELDDAESWAAIRSIIDQPWYDTYQKSLIHLQMMRNATHIHWKWIIAFTVIIHCPCCRVFHSLCTKVGIRPSRLRDTHAHAHN